MFSSFRKILLRSMLVCLALAAVGGAAAIFLSRQNDTLWRLAATAVATAIAAGLMLPASLVAEKPRSRLSGLVALALLIAEYLLGLAALWADPIGWSNDTCEQLLLACGWLAACGIAATIFLRLITLRGAAIAAWTGVGTCAATFVLCMTANWILWNADNDTFEKCLYTAGTVAFFGVVASAALAGPPGGLRRLFRWTAVADCALVATVLTIHTWSDQGGSPTLFFIFAGLAVVLAHGNLATLCPLTPGQKWVRVVAIGALLITAVFVDLSAAFQERDWSHDLVDRLAGAAGLIAGCASLSLLVLARLNRKIDRVPVFNEIKELTLICPGCARKQSVNLADARCSGCGLRFHIRVEEPRCPKCDYSLFMLQSDRCPECGTALTAPARPATANPTPS